MSQTSQLICDRCGDEIPPGEFHQIEVWNFEWDGRGIIAEANPCSPRRPPRSSVIDLLGTRRLHFCSICMGDFLTWKKSRSSEDYYGHNKPICKTIQMKERVKIGDRLDWDGHTWLINRVTSAWSNDSNKYYDVELKRWPPIKVA